MSYQVIARKWRPQAFDEVTGQDHITRTLRNAIEHERLHHAYIFSGARGVGKTTTARLFAKALNCHKTDRPNPSPCRSGDNDICPSCLEITESRSIDVLEFDAASNTQVDKIREIILENINIAPARDRYKVFIIDEVHMLSASSFNALLKTVEEPPPRVVFIMATTELHKVPDTIRSRSQEFVFRTIPQGQILDRLRMIADAENISVEDGALQVIARSGEGSMRDAQSNFDQVISFSGEKITGDDVANALGLAEAEVIAQIIESLATGAPRAAMDVVADLVRRGQDLRVFCRDVLAVIRDLLIYKVSGGDAELIESSVLTPDDLNRYSDRFSEADLVRFFHSLAETEARLKDAVQSRYVLEVGLVKLIEMRRVLPMEELLRRLSELETQLGASPGNDVLTASAATSTEKKTLKSNTRHESEPEALPKSRQEFSSVPPNGEMEQEFSSGPYDPFGERLGEGDFLPNEPELTGAAAPFSPDLEFINSLPVKLPPIAPEDLEHIDDKRLDDLYEQKLEWSGDDLLPIRNAGQLIRSLVGDRPQVSSIHANGDGSAAAPARSPLNIQIPTFEEEDAADVPTLPEHPSEHELFAYANAHPIVRKAMRIFRAKVIAVNKK